MAQDSGEVSVSGNDTVSITGENTPDLRLLVGIEYIETSLGENINYESRASIGIIGSSGGPSDLHKGDSNYPLRDVHLNIPPDPPLFGKNQMEFMTLISNKDRFSGIEYVPFLLLPLDISRKKIKGSSSSPIFYTGQFRLYEDPYNVLLKKFNFENKDIGFKVEFPDFRHPLIQFAYNQSVPPSPPIHIVPPAPDPGILTNISLTKIGVSPTTSFLAFNLTIPGGTPNESITGLLLTGLPPSSSVLVYIGGTPGAVLTPDASGNYDLSPYIGGFANNGAFVDGLLFVNQVTGVVYDFITTTTRTSITGDTSTTMATTGILDQVPGMEFSQIPLVFTESFFTQGSGSLVSLILSDIPNGDIIYLQNPGDTAPVPFVVTGGTFDLLSHGWQPTSSVFTQSNNIADYDIILTGISVNGSGTLPPVTLVFPMFITPPLNPPPHLADMSNIVVTKSLASGFVAFDLTIPGGTPDESITGYVLKGLPATSTVDVYSGGVDIATLSPDSNGNYDLTPYISVFVNSGPFVNGLLIDNMPTANPIIYHFTATTTRTSMFFPSSSALAFFDVMDPVGPEATKIPLEFSPALFLQGQPIDDLQSLLLSGVPAGDFIYLQNATDAVPVAYKSNGEHFDLLAHGWDAQSHVSTEANHLGDYNISLIGVVFDRAQNKAVTSTIIFPMHIVPDDEIPVIQIGKGFGGMDSGANSFMMIALGTILQLGSVDGSDQLMTFSITPGNALPSELTHWNQLDFRATAKDYLGETESLVASFDEHVGQWVFQMPAHSNIVELQNLEIKGPESFQGDLGNFYSSVLFTQDGVSQMVTLPDPFHINVQGDFQGDMQGDVLGHSEGGHHEETVSLAPQSSELEMIQSITAPLSLENESTLLTSPMEDNSSPQFLDVADQSVDAYDGSLISSAPEAVSQVDLSPEPIDELDHSAGVYDSDIVQISGMLPGTTFYDLDDAGNAHTIGFVGGNSMIVLTGEQFRESYFDSPVESGKIDVEIKISDFSHEEFDPFNPLDNTTSSFYEMTVELDENSTHADIGFHAGEDSTQLHVMSLPTYDILSLELNNVGSYHVNELGYLDVIPAQEQSLLDLQAFHSKVEEAIQDAAEDQAYISSDMPSQTISTLDQMGSLLENLHQHQ